MPTHIYVPGRQIYCTNTGFASEFHTRGWSFPEERLTWIDGVEGELKFSIRRPSDSYQFKAEVTPVSGGGMQRLEIFFNFFRVGFFEIGQTTSIQLELPVELFIMRSARLVFHCPDAARGTDIGLIDPRRLGIAFRSWVIE